MLWAPWARPFWVPLGVMLFTLVLGGCGGNGSDAPTETTVDARSMDGTGNNLSDPGMGASYTVLLRAAPAAYGDGIASPAGADRPGAREISNIVCNQQTSKPNQRGLTDWVWQWGQFIDHDITLIPIHEPTESFPVAVPPGDPFFDPAGTGIEEIPCDRSTFDPATGMTADSPRQQVNEITAFLDASQIYGADSFRAAWLRSGEGGKLKTSAGDLLPFSDGTQPNAGPGGASSYATDLFTAGDQRANEHAGLIAVHTLFVREHNRLAEEIAAEHVDWDDERIYQQARKTVGALIQVITYQEFLPALLGPFAPDPEAAVYDPEVDAGISNVFATASFRLGHTIVSPQLLRLETADQPIPEGPLPLREAFFTPRRVLDEGGVEPLLLGFAHQPMQEVDPLVVNDLRNFLVGPPGAGGFDLASLNIQRGRDHGLPDYNTVRQAFGLEPVASFAEITSDAEIQDRLAAAYGGVDQIDPWIGGIAEDHLPGASVGQLIAAVLVDQFTRLRDGDRFWCANDPGLAPEELAELEATRLADIIRRNTSITDIPDDVFRL